MLMEYLLLTESADFDLTRLQVGDIVNQKFLLDAMPLPADSPAPILASLGRMRAELHSALFDGATLRPAYTKTAEWRQRIDAFAVLSPSQTSTAGTAATAAPAPFEFVPLLQVLQDAFVLRLRDRQAAWGVGALNRADERLHCSHRVAVAVEALTSAMVHDWLIARVQSREAAFQRELGRFGDFFRALLQTDQNPDMWSRSTHAAITTALMYLATHLFFVQTDYSSKTSRQPIVAGRVACCFLEVNLYLPQQQHNAELLAECVAVFFEDADFHHLCLPLWRSGVAEPHRLPKLPAAGGKIRYKHSKQIHHFIVTLMHIHLCMRRALGSRQAPVAGACPDVRSSAVATSNTSSMHRASSPPPPYCEVCPE
jgi:hypothetical protein